MTKLTVLLTGAGGRIGPHILPDFKADFNLRLLNLHPIEGEETILSNLQDVGVLRTAMRGCDVVVHLAATSDEAPFLEQLVPNNIIGLYNVFEAARAEKVRRLVFASSVQAVSLYPPENTVRGTDLPRPETLYGVTKALGEVMGRYYHDRHGLEFVGVRIGWFQPYDSPLLRANDSTRRTWLSPRDCSSFLRAAASRPGIGYAVVNATSKTIHEFLSLADAREHLDWEPQDSVEALYPSTGTERTDWPDDWLLNSHPR